MKTYDVTLSEDLSTKYEYIANMNKRTVEDCLAIILERVIRTMLNLPGETHKN